MLFLGYIIKKLKFKSIMIKLLIIYKMNKNMQDDFKIYKQKHDFEKGNIKKMWEHIAQRPSEFDIQVINALKSTIISNNNSNNNNNEMYKCYGEQLYIHMRQSLINFKNTDNKKINFLINKHNIIPDNNNYDICKTNNKQHKQIKQTKNNATIIREESTINKLNERLNIILKSFNLVNFTIPSENVMKSNILEIRALGFIYICWFIYTNKYTDNIIPFSIIVSLQRFINIISNDNNIISNDNNNNDNNDINNINIYCGNNAMNTSETMYISKTLIEDLKYFETILIKLYLFNGITLYEQARDLILGSSFDIYLPRNTLEPFGHQKIVSSSIMNIENIKNGFIMFYRTMTNSGKTSSIINIAAAVQELRIKYPSHFANLQVIATCDVQPVITRWGQLLYHAGIPFGIGAKRIFPTNSDSAFKVQTKARKEMEYDKDCVDINMRFSNSDTCKSINERIAIICPTDIALKILSLSSNANKRFILLHDEPTMYASSLSSSELTINMQIIQHAPKWSIFSSATLPYDVKSQIFIQHHQTKFPNSKFIDNYSTEIYSCCNLKTFDNICITPHLNCTSRLELINAIQHIIKNPFLGKLYTPTSIKLLYDESREVGAKHAEFIKQLPNIIEIFNNVKNLYPDNIRKVAIDILNAITLLNDKQITYICSMDYESESDSESESDNNSDNSDNSDNKYNENYNKSENESGNKSDEHKNKEEQTNFKNLGTSDAHKYPYLNLIASLNPMEFMNINYNNLVVDITKKIGSLDKLEYEYEQELCRWTKIFNALEKTYTNATELSMEQSYMHDVKPSLIFPDECQINTKQHVQKYKKHNSYIQSSKYRIPNSLNTFNNININDLHITDNNKIHLLSGVCCYAAPDTTDIDISYLDTVLELTSQQKIETLIADNSICYGTDYPIGGVIITKEFSDKYTLNTIYQLMSRAGRGRKSNNAEIYIDISCANKILNTVKQGVNADSIETDNMIAIFNSLLQK